MILSSATDIADNTFALLPIDEIYRSHERSKEIIKDALIAYGKAEREKAIGQCSALVWAHRYDASASCDTFADVGKEIDRLKYNDGE